MGHFGGNPNLFNLPGGCYLCLAQMQAGPSPPPLAWRELQRRFFIWKWTNLEPDPAHSLKLDCPWKSQILKIWLLCCLIRTPTVADKEWPDWRLLWSIWRHSGHRHRRYPDPLLEHLGDFSSTSFKAHFTCISGPERAYKNLSPLLERWNCNHSTFAVPWPICTATVLRSPASAVPWRHEFCTIRRYCASALQGCGEELRENAFKDTNAVGPWKIMDLKMSG